ALRCGVREWPGSGGCRRWADRGTSGAAGRQTFPRGRIPRRIAHRDATARRLARCGIAVVSNACGGIQAGCAIRLAEVEVRNALEIAAQEGLYAYALRLRQNRLTLLSRPASVESGRRGVPAAKPLPSPQRRGVLSPPRP